VDRTANQAAFWSGYGEAAYIAGYLAGWPSSRTRITSLDLKGVGHSGRATIIWFPGGAGSVAFIALSRGHVTDSVALNANKSDLPMSDVEALARAMANRLDAGVSS
jgi:hypothetical protein